MFYLPHSHLPMRVVKSPLTFLQKQRKMVPGSPIEFTHVALRLVAKILDAVDLALLACKELGVVDPKCLKSETSSALSVRNETLLRFFQQFCCLLWVKGTKANLRLSVHDQFYQVVEGFTGLRTAVAVVRFHDLIVMHCATAPSCL